MNKSTINIGIVVLISFVFTFTSFIVQYCLCSKAKELDSQVTKVQAFEQTGKGFDKEKGYHTTSGDGKHHHNDSSHHFT